MTSENISSEGIAGEIPQRAVSLYGQGDGVEDFPVLKAFQQYIDAEQEKARKRIIWLGIFFGAILIVVVGVFMFLLHGINMRNQTLNDRLFDAMKEAATCRQMPTTAVAPQAAPQNDAVLKSMTETLVALQKKMQDANTAKVEQSNAMQDPKLLAETQRLQREKASLEAERKRLDEERERLRQIEIDRQRRKLYPELYEEPKAPSRAKTRMLTDDDIRDIIREAYPQDEGTVNKAAERPKKTNDATSSEEPVIPLDEDTAIDYFKDDDYNIPVDVKGSSTKIKFTVPVD